MKFFLITLFLFTAFFTETFAQSSSIVNSRLRMVAMGKLEEVRAGLPELQDQFPDDDGVLFLSAIVTDNALRALRIYEGILKNSPKSEWADDAQLRIVQYWALKRDTTKALLELQNYRVKYPASEFLLAATDMVKATVGPPARASVRPAESITTATPGEIIPKKTEIPKTNEKPLKEPLKEVLKEPVKKEPVKPEPKTPETVKTEPWPPPAKTNESIVLKESRWGLQVGVYAERESAESEVNRFKSKRLKTAILNKDVNGKLWFAVVVGDYSSRESAEKAHPVVQAQCECTPFVVEK
ncbi:MAG: SPOR domain-containing protein [Bacteroidota bacterium]